MFFYFVCRWKKIPFAESIAKLMYFFWIWVLISLRFCISMNAMNTTVWAASPSQEFDVQLDPCPITSSGNKTNLILSYIILSIGDTERKRLSEWRDSWRGQSRCQCQCCCIKLSSFPSYFPLCCGDVWTFLDSSHYYFIAIVQKCLNPSRILPIMIQVPLYPVRRLCTLCVEREVWRV